MTDTLVTIERPEPPAVVAEVSPIVAVASKFVVKDVASHALALERFQALRRAEKALVDHFEPTRASLDRAKRELLLARDRMIGPIAAARSIYDGEARRYEREEKLKAEAEERRLAEQARREEEDRIVAAAAEAEDQGNAVEAESIVSQPVSAPMITIEPAVARVEGVSSRRLWSAEVVSLIDLVRFVASNEQYVEVLMGLRRSDDGVVTSPGLNKIAQAQRGALKIPGVRVVESFSRASR